MPERTTISYLRAGRPLKLIQPLSPERFPKCVQCGKTIPPTRRRWQGSAWFCSGKCAQDYGQEVAGQVWIKPEGTRYDSPQSEAYDRRREAQWAKWREEAASQKRIAEQKRAASELLGSARRP
jgi:hypothetical protein